MAKTRTPLAPFMHPGVMEAGCDEAGRGCLAGPVACAAVILPEGFECPGLNDSKQLTERQREQLRPIIENKALAWAVVMIPPETIDSINILNASILGMHRALDALSVRPEHILVDGNRFHPYFEAGNRPGTNPTADADGLIMRGTQVPHTTVVKGDGKYLSIAAASVLAKTHRDELMRRLAAEHPGYGWEQNMGYPTAAHKEAIARLGLTSRHRRSFRHP